MKHQKESVGSPAPNEAGRSGSVKPAKNRILVVDDDSTVREMLTRVLVGEGFLVWAAADGTAALEVAAAAKVDLVLLDLNMPGKSGWDTFERLIAGKPLAGCDYRHRQVKPILHRVGCGGRSVAGKAARFSEAASNHQPAARRTRIGRHTSALQSLRHLVC